MRNGEGHDRNPGAATLAELERIYRGDGRVTLDDSARERVETSARVIREAAAGEVPSTG